MTVLSTMRTVVAALAMAVPVLALPTTARGEEEELKRAQQQFLEILDKLLGRGESPQDFRRKHEAEIERWRHERPPPIPESARQAMAQGNAAFAAARSRSGLAGARDAYTSAIDAAPWWAAPYFNLGVTYLQLRDHRRAADCFDLYLLAAPNAPDAATVRQKLREAESLADRQRRVQSLMAEGREHQSAKRLAGAAMAYGEALRLDPDNAEGQSRLGAALADSRPVDALLHLRKALRLGESSAYTYNWLGVAYDRIGDRREALAQFLKAREAEDGATDPYIAYNIGITAYNLDEYRQAVPYFDEALMQGHPDQARIERLLDWARPRAVPCVDAKGMRAYSDYLRVQVGKAFAIAPDGAWGARTSDNESMASIARAAVANCQRHTGATCVLYAEGNNVVLSSAFACQRG